jgi:putative MATE family efflux protein
MFNPGSMFKKLSIPGGVSPGIDRATLKEYRKTIINLAIPSMIEYILISMIMIVDTAIVGRLGAHALAVVSISWSILFFFMMISFAINQGSVAIIARYVGSGNMKWVSRATGQAIMLNFLFALTGAAIIYAFTPELFSLMGVTPEVKNDGVIFLRILTFTYILDSFTIASNSALKASGDTRTPMKITGVENVVNAVLDYVLVFGIFGFAGFGLQGSAIATAIARCIGVFLSFGGLMLGWYKVRVSFRDIYLIRWKLLSRIMKVGWPSIVDSSFFSSASLVFTRIVAGLGTIPLAVNGILLRAESLSFMPGISFAVAAGILVGQSLGEGNQEKAKIMAWESSKLAMLVMGIMGSVFFFAPRMIIGMFTTDLIVISSAAMVLRIIGPIQPVGGLMFVMRGALAGAGDTKSIMRIGLIGMWLVRVPFAYLFAITIDMGVMGAWGAMSLHIAIASLMLLSRFRSGEWMSIKV